MQFSTGLVGATTLLFHGTHVIGHGAWANRYLMCIDTSAVIFAAIIHMWYASGYAPMVCAIGYITSFVLWISTFGPLYGLPYNFMLSIIHGIGFILSINAIQAVC